MKELFPIIVAPAILGHTWTCHQVFFHVDNMVVVTVLQKRSAKDLLLTYLHCLFLCDNPYYRKLKCGHGYLVSQLCTCLLSPLSTGTTFAGPCSSPGYICAQEARLGLRRVDKTVLSIFNQGIANSTAISYKVPLRRNFTNECELLASACE